MSQESTYQRAVELAESINPDKVFDAARVFESLGDFEDAAERAAAARQRSNELRYEYAMRDIADPDPRFLERAVEAFEQLGEYSDAAEKLEEAKAKLAAAKEVIAKKTLRNRLILAAVVLIIVAVAGGMAINHNVKCSQAAELSAAGQHAEAAEIYASVGEDALAESEHRMDLHAQADAAEDPAQAAELYAAAGDEASAARADRDAKAEYVYAHLDDPDELTFAYVTELSGFGYQGMGAIYEQLYYDRLLVDYTLADGVATVTYTYDASAWNEFNGTTLNVTIEIYSAEDLASNANDDVALLSRTVVLEQTNGTVVLGTFPMEGEMALEYYVYDAETGDRIARDKLGLPKYITEEAFSNVSLRR